MALGEAPPPGFYDEGAEPRPYLNGTASGATESERVPPHDLDAEAAVLSAVMLDPLALDRVNEFLRTEHFYAEAHRRMHEACVELRAAGMPIDVVQVGTWLRDRDRLAQVGGMAYLTEVLNAAPAVTNVVAYAHTVQEKWRVRQLAIVCQRVVAQAHTGYGDAARFVETAIEQVTGLRPIPPLADSVLDGAAIGAQLSPVDYLVREMGLVAGGGAPDLIAGYGFSGKSAAVQALALSLASGRPVWAAYRVSQRRVIHVDLEQGERLTRRRYQRIARAIDVDLPRLGDALSLSVMPDGLRLTSACEQRWRALMTGRDLLIVDSLRAATGGQDENSSDMRTGLDMLGALSNSTSCRVLVIHHARKPGNADSADARFAIRGSGAIFDACDAVYLFTAEKGEPVRVQHVKARSHGEPVEDFALVIADLEIDDDPFAGLRVEVRGADLLAERRERRVHSAREDEVRRDAEAIRKVVLEQPGIKAADLRAAARLSGDRVKRAMVALVDVVDVRSAKVGKIWVCQHYLKGLSS